MKSPENGNEICLAEGKHEELKPWCDFPWLLALAFPPPKPLSIGSLGAGVAPGAGGSPGTGDLTVSFLFSFCLFPILFLDEASHTSAANLL